jgi:hypothetical protein
MSALVIRRPLSFSPMLKSLVKRAAKAISRYSPDISLATSPHLRWPIKEKLAQIEMATRSMLNLKFRLSFLSNARYVKKYRLPDCQQVGPIWQYWNSGADGRPPIIRECMDSVRRHTSGREIILLSDDTLHDYIALPPQILIKRERMGATAFSDWLRVGLLAEHGGTWIDASVLLTGSIDKFTSALPFFVFTRRNDPWMISSWFIHSVAGHPLACVMRDLITEYWALQDEVRAYFMFHFLFESALTLHTDLRETWKKIPTMFAEVPHLLHEALLAGSDSQRLRDICCRYPLHKLSWKYPEAVLLEAERTAKWSRNLRSPTMDSSEHSLSASEKKKEH